MSEPEYDEDQTQNHDEIEDDQQLEVSAVFVSERPAVSGRGGKSTSKGKSATRRSKVFVTGVSDLTATEFSRKVVKALELVTRRQSLSHEWRYRSWLIGLRPSRRMIV
ncbi:hypothetical protein FRC06_010692 [Ceratobasidium sp. 370]|nr:hypothetical protein FRC06_010692 [Ceratobasidium sp. 370]